VSSTFIYFTYFNPSVTKQHNTFIHLYTFQSTSPGTHTAVIFRFSHVLGDGYSWMYLLLECVCDVPTEISVIPDYFSRGSLLMFVFYLTFPFRLAWATAGLVCISMKSYPLRVNRSTSDKKSSSGSETGRYVWDITKKIQMRKIKEVKNRLRISFSSVQFAAMAGALREYHEGLGLEVPEVYPCLTVLPYPGHPLSRLRNHLYDL
jgi:hypothetical protein